MHRSSMWCPRLAPQARPMPPLQFMPPLLPSAPHLSCPPCAHAPCGARKSGRAGEGSVCGRRAGTVGSPGSSGSGSASAAPARPAARLMALRLRLGGTLQRVVARVVDVSRLLPEGVRGGRAVGGCGGRERGAGADGRTRKRASDITRRRLRAAPPSPRCRTVREGRGTPPWRRPTGRRPRRNPERPRPPAARSPGAPPECRRWRAGPRSPGTGSTTSPPRPPARLAFSIAVGWVAVGRGVGWGAGESDGGVGRAGGHWRRRER